MAGNAMSIREKIAAAVIAGKGLKLDAEETGTLSEVVQMMAALRTDVLALRQGWAEISDKLAVIARCIHNELSDHDILARMHEATERPWLSGMTEHALKEIGKLLEEIRTSDNAVARLELRDFDWGLGFDDA
jgi:hypothetical protein